MSTRLTILLLLALAGCGQAERLSRIGRAPDFSPIADPTQDPRWRPVSMPMPAPSDAPPLANSLWRPGSRRRTCPSGPSCASTTSKIVAPASRRMPRAERSASADSP